MIANTITESGTHFRLYAVSAFSICLTCPLSTVRLKADTTEPFDGPDEAVHYRRWIVQYTAVHAIPIDAGMTMRRRYQAQSAR